MPNDIFTFNVAAEPDTCTGCNTQRIIVQRRAADDNDTAESYCFDCMWDGTIDAPNGELVITVAN